MTKIYLLLFSFILSISVNAQWTQVGQDVLGEAEQDAAGMYVSMNGDGSIMAVSAHTNDYGGTNAGQVRVFELVDNLWVQLGEDIYGEHPGDIARAISLSESGFRIAVGAQYNEDGGYEAGNVRVFEFTDGDWQQIGGDIDGVAEEDWCGYAVALSGNGQRVIAGSPNNDGSGTDAGHARVYELIDNEWVQLGEDLEGEAAGDSFGDSVTINYAGDRVAVGGYLNQEVGSGGGHVRVFEFATDSWNQLGDDIDAQAIGDFFGRSIALSADGNTLVAGAPNNGNAGTHSGNARIFGYTEGAWEQIGQEINGESSNDNCGISVDISYDGTMVILGAYRHDGVSSDTGHARMFRLELGSWVQLGDDIQGYSAIDYFGRGVSMNGSGYTVIAGAHSYDGNGTNAGLARVFSHPSPCTNSSQSLALTECGSYTVPSGDETYTTAGTYTVLDTIPNLGGCDSLLTIELTINLPNGGTDTQTACDSFTWIDGNTYSESTNTPTFALTNVAGCDSIVTLDLTITESTFGTDTQSACDSFTWIDGNTYTESTDTPIYILTNIAGCDSIVTLNLSITETIFGTDTQSACDSFTWIDGNTYTESTNNPTYTLTSVAGCDSIVTLNLTINTADASVSQLDPVLTAGEENATYQWLICPDMTPIDGETNQSFTATENGDYAVMIIDNNGCEATSSCYAVIVDGIDEKLVGQNFELYPNPTNGNFSIDLGESHQFVAITVFDLEGKMIHAEKHTNLQYLTLSVELAAGVYLVNIEADDSRGVVRLVKEQ